MALKNVHFLAICVTIQMIQNTFTQIAKHALKPNNLLKVGYVNKIYKEKVHSLPLGLKELIAFNKRIGVGKVY